MAPTPAPCSEPETPSPISLVAPFAVLGLVGGFLSVVLVFGTTGLEGALLGPVILSVTSFSAGLGFVATQMARIRFALGGAAALVAAIAATGPLTGGFAGAVALGMAGRSECGLLYLYGGASLGLSFSSAFVPALLLLFFAARRIRHVRAGTVVDRSQRAGIWTHVCFSVAVASGLVSMCFPRGSERAGVVLALAAVATGAMGLLAIADARRLKELRAVSVRLQRVAAADEPLGEVEVDLGLGEEHWLLAADRGAPYRGNVLTPCIRGAFLDVQRLLWRAATAHVVELAACALILVLAFRAG